MIIPPRCFTCGKPIADKWIPFIKLINEKKKDSKVNLKNNDLDVQFIDTSSITGDKSIEGKVLDDLGLHKYCCRMPFLSNVHLITSI
tara:strand:- start:116 stop:376 length:261 start_codon:yes stop_codon:yes gene_type:complete